MESVVMSITVSDIEELMERNSFVLLVIMHVT